MSTKKLIKALGLIIVVALLAVALPLQAKAQTGPTPDMSWYNETDTSFTLVNADDLAGLAQLVNAGNSFEGKSILLGNDISLSTYPNWVPIGTEGKPFKGTFDGAEKKISDLSINESSAVNVGLFGYVWPGTLKNVSIETVDISAKEAVGSLVGSMNGTIENVHVSGVTMNSTHWAGGIVGYHYGNMSNCSAMDIEITLTFDTEIEDNGDKAGGLIGYHGEGNFAINDCTAELVSVTGVRDVGGLVGAAQTGNIFTNCHVIDSTVTASDETYVHLSPYAGGIIGRAANATVTLRYSSAVDVTVTSYVDGFAGNLVGGPASNWTNLPVMLVSGENKSYFSTIQAAVNAASAGGTVNVAAGTYEENLIVDKAINLIGAGRDVTTVQAVEGRNYNGGDFQSPIVKITGDAALLNLLPLEITSPSGIAGKINGSLANFGPQPGDDEWNVSGEVVYASDPLGGTVPNNVSGKIALIDRGTYGFSVKAYNAEQGGAIGVIIANTTDDLITMGVTAGYENINIPVVMIKKSDAEAIKAQTENVTAAYQADPYDLTGESITISGFTFHGVVPPEVPNPGGATGDWGTSGIEHLTTQGIETDSALNYARQNITIKDNKFVYAGASIALYNVTGFEVSNNIMERASYYYNAPEGYEQYKPHGGQIVHTSGVKNGLVKNNVGFDPSGTISIGGSDIVVKNNTIQAPIEPLEGDLDIDQYGISVMFAAHVNIEGNTISGLEAGPKSGYTNGWPGEGIWVHSSASDVTIIGNTLSNNVIGVHVEDAPAVGGPVLRGNKFIDNVYSILNQKGNIGTAVNTVDAKENYWNSATGPNVYSVTEMGATSWAAFYDLVNGTNPPFPEFAVSDKVDFAPWCKTEDCLTLMPDENGVIDLTPPEGGDPPAPEEIQTAINNAPSGSTIVIPAGTYTHEGAFVVSTPNLTIKLSDGTIIQNSSRCFTVDADNVTITSETIGGAACVPTNGSDGIVVNDGVSGVIIEGLEIDGSGQTTGDGIHFAGPITNFQIVNNYIHDLGGNAIEFVGTPSGTTMDIQGNLFKTSTLGTPVIVVPTGLSPALNAQYNNWDAMTSPTIANVDTSNNTYASLRLTSMNTPWPNQVAVGEIIKYNVVADLQNVTGAAFTLSYPTNLTLVATDPITLPGVFTNESVNISTTGKLVYVGYNQASGGNPVEVESGSGIVLFTASFTATPTGSGTLTFSEDGFSMMPPSGPSNLVYTNSMTDGSVTVIDLPTLTWSDDGSLYSVGYPHDFTLTITNLNGGTFTPNLTFDSGNFTITGNTTVGTLNPGDTKVLTLQITFTASGEQQVIVRLEDPSSDPAGFDLAYLAKNISVGATYSVLGEISMQGRTFRGNVPVALTKLDVPVYGPFPGTTVAQLGTNLTISNLPSGSYEFTTSQARYLNITAALDKQFTLGTANYTLPALMLRGGDVVDDEQIDVNDAGFIGGAYGTSGNPADIAADANFDGTVNIQDLALVGGNFDLTSDTAYEDWTP